jgi:antitoxin component YwqK of YwqJK toxin-antitoxin module
MTRLLGILFGILLALSAMAQSVEPFVDHWDAKKTIKRSEGLMVNGREWGEWKFYDREGRLAEQAEFKSGERDGRVRIYYENGQVQHDGWFKRGQEDSLRVSRYRNGSIMERGLHKNGRKTGVWAYNHPDSIPMLREVWQDSLVLVTDAWDSTGVATIREGNGVLRTWFPSGTLQEECSYAMGVRDGPCVLNHPAGNHQQKGQYRGGVKVGRWEYGYSSGKPEKIEHYDAGPTHRHLPALDQGRRHWTSPGVMPMASRTALGPGTGPMAAARWKDPS